MTFKKIPHIVVVGGGITGLSAAFYLKQAAENANLPLQCTLIEKDGRIGGKIRTYRDQQFILEGGPDSMLARKPAGLELIRKLGLESEIIGTNPAAHKTYIFQAGKLYAMPTGTNLGIPVSLSPFLQNDLLSPGGKLRALADLILPADIKKDDESLGQFLRRRFGNELVDALCEPLLAGIYAGRIDDLDMESTFPQFRKLEQENRSVILGLRRQKQTLPTVTPSGRSVFISLRGGLETLTERLGEYLLEWLDFRLHTSVLHLTKNTTQNYTLTLRTETGEDTSIDADAVIVTTPAPVAAQILRETVPSAEQLAQIPYISTATILVGYLKEQVHVELDASGFLIPRNEHRAITASTWVSSKWPHTTPDDHVMIRCYVGRSGQEEHLSKSDAELVQLVQKELSEILHITATPVFSKVTRWMNSMPQYLVHHKQHLQQVKAQLKLRMPSVFIAGAGYEGIGIPDCIMQGQLTATEAFAQVYDSNRNY